MPWGQKVTDADMGDTSDDNSIELRTITMGVGKDDMVLSPKLRSMVKFRSVAVYAFPVA